MWVPPADDHPLLKELQLCPGSRYRKLTVPALLWRPVGLIPKKLREADLEL